MNRFVLPVIAIVAGVLIAGPKIWKLAAPRKVRDPFLVQVQAESAPKAKAADAAKARRDAAVAARHEKTRAKCAEQSAELAKLLAAGQQFSKLPSWIERVSVDSKGQAWLEGEATDDDKVDAIKESVAQAAAGSTQLIRGKLLLHDRAGRFWMGVPSNPDRLLGYDGRRWIERQALNVGEAELKGKPTSLRGRFLDRGFEDSKGNLYFFAQITHQGGMNLHRRAVDGTWTYEVLIDASDKKVASAILRDPVFVEQAAGMITLCNRLGTEDECNVLHLDGSKWQVLDVRVCKSKGHSTLQVIPLPDGSVLTICGGSRLWEYWPPEALKRMQDQTEALAEQLQAIDPTDRETAQQLLARMGPTILPRLKQVQPALTVPESKARVAAIIQTLTKLQADLSAETHDHASLYAGRYTYDACYVTARSVAGRTLFYVENCVDTFTKKSYRGAFATVRADGTWRLDPVDLNQWRSMDYKHYPKDAFVDSKGRLWLEDSLRVTPDRKLERVSSGFQYDKVLGEDFAGRFYLVSGSDRYVLNESAAAAKPELPETKLSNVVIYPSAGTVGGWAQASDGNHVTSLLRLNGALPQTIAKWDDVGVQRIVPLRGEMAIVQFFAYDGVPTNRTKWVALWDGKAWHEAEDLPTLVHQEVELLRANADVDMSDRSMTPIASDGNGNLWFHRQHAIGVNGFDDLAELLEYFDGKTWHNVRAELKAQNSKYEPTGELARSADRGKTILLGAPMLNEMLAISYLNAAIKSSLLNGCSSIDGVCIAGGLLDRSTGEILLNGDPSLRMNNRRYHNGALDAATFHETPIFSDSLGIVYAVSPNHQLIARKGELSGSISINGLNDTAKMVQGGDGRIWLLAPDALHQVTVVSSANALILKDASQWSWGVPRMQFDRAFCDQEKGLWFSPGGTTAIRVVLP